MLTILLLLRFLADYFWSVKAISVVHAIVAAGVLLLMFRRKLVGRLTALDGVVLLFAIWVLFVLVVNPGGGYVDFLKLLSIPLFYFLGRFSYGYYIHGKVLFWISIVCLVVFFVAVFMGYGYQYWGSIETFTGGYFFKTDLALAVLIFTALIFVYSESRSRVLWLVFFMSAYVIWASNARIAFAGLGVTLFFYAQSRGYLRFGVKNFLIITCLGCLFLVLLMSADWTDSSVLLVDFSDFFGEKNLQGRNWIWVALIEAYGDYPILKKIVGGGFDADIVATNQYSLAFALDGSRAHNSFLYLLLALGLVGLLIFTLIIIIASNYCRAIIVAGRTEDDVMMATILGCIFLIFSMTTEAVIRAQITVPLALYLGRTSLYFSLRRKF